MYPVRYPASRKQRARVGSSRRRGKPFQKTPVEVAYRPVCMLAREGAHTGWQVNELKRSVPSIAARSKFGVSPRGLPCTPVVSQRC